MPQNQRIVRTENALRKQAKDWTCAGVTTAFVPTMGALHDGHLSLVRLAKKKADRIIVSIFVNPTQFAPGEDLDAYPRTEKADVAMLKAEGVDLIYIPRAGSMYNAHHATSIHIGGVAQGLETNHRPTFFNGVVLVVTKLFNRVRPDIAIFGEKDYQQLATVRRLSEDLDMPVKIIGAPIARDASGLALSSRNQYFDATGLNIARQLNVIMRACAKAIKNGKDISSETAICSKTLVDAGFDAIDYVTVVNARTLEPLTHTSENTPKRLLIAAHCKGVRLIDNCAI
ncbi:MAG: pantoate--beta-alanine ligase [Litorimonas sp.]